jgi:predicted PurR-regulated permease PerM
VSLLVEVGSAHLRRRQRNMGSRPREIMFGIDLRVARAVLTAVLVLAALYCVYAVRMTLLLVVYAVFFSYLVLPVVVALERTVKGRLPRDLIIAAAFAIVLGAIALAVGGLGSQLVTEAARFANDLPHLLDPATLARRLPLPGLLEPFRDRLAELIRDIVGGAQLHSVPAASRIGAGVLTVAGSLVYTVVVPIFSFLMVRSGPAIKQELRARAAKPDGSFWYGLAMDINFLLARYVRALALLSLATLFSYGVVLSLLRVPFGLLLAGAAALLEVIPVFGPLVAAIAILTTAVFSGYPHVLWVLGFLVGYRIFQDYILSPYLMSEGVDVPAIAVVFGLLAGDEVGGVAGIFLSVPVIATVRIVIARLRNHLALRKGAGERR